MAQHARHIKSDPAYRPVANPALAEGMRMLRRSNAAGTHADRRTRKNRSRAAQRDNAIREARD